MATLRMHFTADDLGRVRIAPRVDELWEIVLSLHVLRAKEPTIAFDGWRHRARDAIRRAGNGTHLALLHAINPPARFFPDFLTPLGHRGGLTDGLEAIRSTPARQLRAELTLLDRLHRAPSSLRPLAEGSTRSVSRLCAALRHYHQLALGPYSPCIERRVGEARRRHSELMATGGTEQLLRSLGPSIRWRSPVLEASFLRDRDVYLDGRGLLLVPSFFCMGKPVPFFDPELPPVLVYPITHDPRWTLPEPSRDTGPLADLVGDARLRLLERIEDTAGASTQSLSDLVRLSPSTVSYHTKLLRNAGLITSRRDGPSVVHLLTPLGAALLNAAPAPA